MKFLTLIRTLVIGSTLTLSACASLDDLRETPHAVPGGVVLERYQKDQELRRQGPTHWAVDGTLEIETPDQGRRNRIELLGSGWSQVRMRVRGPFQEIAAELHARDDRVRWVDPEHRKVTEVPATSEGLYHLIGVPIEPEHLFAWIMGEAESLLPASTLPLEPAGARSESRDGERLWLDPENGRIRERRGNAGPGSHYRAVYTWPDPAARRASAHLMPESIQITLDKPKVRMEFVLRNWRYPAEGPTKNQFEQALDVGFSLLRPLDSSMP
ncbi:MAG: hypothetical protein HQL86_04090 [Magnetococcales bacterium]|nr:hypothetical protein [Magnetococcales bacterium]